MVMSKREHDWAYKPLPEEPGCPHCGHSRGRQWNMDSQRVVTFEEVGG